MAKKSKSQSMSDEEKIVTGLLTPEDRLVLTQIGAGTALWSRRAQALLAVEDGATNQAAGEAAGLRDTQVKYWVDAFRRKGMAVFPEDVVNGIDILSGDPGKTSPEQDASFTESTANKKKIKKVKQPKKSKVKKGKSKKGKASKKKRKGKKKKGQGKKKTK